MAKKLTEAGHAIQRLQATAGLNDELLAGYLGVTVETIRNWKYGKAPKLYCMIAIEPVCARERAVKLKAVSR